MIVNAQNKVQWSTGKRETPSSFLALYPLYVNMHHWCLNYGDRKNVKSSRTRNEGHLMAI